MRILLAGATGVIGRQTVPILTGAGHQVTGLARTRPGCPTPRWWRPTPWTQPPSPTPCGRPRPT
jgi:uncharacterized protein YbjT (DUF2867 family)